MYYIIIIAIIALDQLTKYFVQIYMELNYTIPVIEGMFHFTYIHNYGAAFSMLENRQGLLLTVTGIVIAAMLVYLIRKRKTAHPMFLFSLALVVGGGVGNLMDRALQGYVVDFFDFRVWPIFNVADISVVCGCMLLSFFVLFWEPRHMQKQETMRYEEEK